MRRNNIDGWNLPIQLPRNTLGLLIKPPTHNIRCIPQTTLTPLTHITSRRPLPPDAPSLHTPPISRPLPPHAPSLHTPPISRPLPHLTPGRPHVLPGVNLITGPSEKATPPLPSKGVSLQPGFETGGGWLA
ncbi:hypothetical protein Pcinc_036396 [Petrolisthes cinctipes]|uniref:Uncharacterized protein n=1 Tax=Petrolisthes cinctipes TaxID=88211 RepID=A0AAE1BYP4_PETCI|nr:hypothetical protein Pcinc_036396 [Petrolisthes cinctipes]